MKHLLKKLDEVGREVNYISTSDVDYKVKNAFGDIIDILGDVIREVQTLKENESSDENNTVG